MAQVTIVYWRDMPAQIIVGKGRRGAKAPLPERFEQAIDRAAMKSGAAETDAYLDGFRKADPYPVDGEDADVAAAEAAIGLAILVIYYRGRGTIAVDDVNRMKG